MAKSNRTCFLCKNSYSYCPTCNADINKPSWYALWCSEVCKELNDILSAHTAKKITTEYAKEQLLSVDMSKVNILKEATSKHIEEILSYKVEQEVVEIVEDKAIIQSQEVSEINEINEINEVLVEPQEDNQLVATTTLYEKKRKRK